MCSASPEPHARSSTRASRGSSKTPRRSILRRCDDARRATSSVALYVSCHFCDSRLTFRLTSMTVARKRAVDAPTAEARKPRVSLVIPTLNEDLAEPLVMLGDYLRGLDEWTFEILFVDDSKD